MQVWPVIHVSPSLNTAFENAELAKKHGAEGVLLISMDGNAELVDRAIDVIRHNLDIKIGANYLGHNALMGAFQAANKSLDAIWTDQALVVGGRHDPAYTPEESMAYRTMRAHLTPRLADKPFFAACAFKGQVYDHDPGASAHELHNLGFIPTTSGPGTGRPPGEDHLQAIRTKYAIDLPLALASGVTPENVHIFKPYISHILVATGISSGFYSFDEVKLAALMERSR